MRVKSASLFALTTSLLAACGGGSGNSAPTTTMSAPPVVASAPSAAPALIDTSLQSVIPVTTYPTGSVALAAFNLLNEARSHCGFGLLKQSAQIDSAAQAHARYLVNTQDISHNETQAGHAPYFTGTTPQARMTAAGYGALGGAESFVAGSGAPPAGDASTRLLLSAPFHLIAMMGPWRDVGIGAATIPATAGSTQVTNATVFDFGYLTSIQETGDVRTYPCEGSTGVQNFPQQGESPDPFPGRNYHAKPMGVPILVKGPDAATLVVSAATVQQTGGSPLTLNILTAANYPSAINTSEVLIIPDSPLASNTLYLVSLSGTSGGVPFSRSFAFTTGLN